jgi:hypothetical protein
MFWPCLAGRITEASVLEASRFVSLMDRLAWVSPDHLRFHLTQSNKLLKAVYCFHHEVDAT